MVSAQDLEKQAKSLYVVKIGINTRKIEFI